MSLFEKLKNKRYDLQEAPIDDKGNITPEPGEVKKSEKILKKFNKKQKKIEQQNIRKNTQQGDQLLKDIICTRNQKILLKILMRMIILIKKNKRN